MRSGGETNELEGAIVSLSPPRTESWSPSQPDTIRESQQPIAQEQQTPTSFLRNAYQDGRLKVLGREEVDGRSPWHLSILPDSTRAPEALNGSPIPNTTVTVDASTFVPIESLDYSVSSASGKPTLETTRVRYLTYEELPLSSASLSLLSLAAHPGAKVVKEGAPSEG